MICLQFRIFLFFFYSFFVYSILNASEIENCKLFSIESKEFKNFKIGEDLSPEAPERGFYKCDLYYQKKYKKNILYVGEVGDSAYLKIVDSNNESKIIFNHGYLEKKYKRVLPLFVNLEDYQLNSGKYIAYVYYENFVPSQKGIRSGKPEILDFNGFLSRVLFDNFKVIYLVFEVFFVLILFFSTALNGFIDSMKNKVLFMLLTLMVILSVFSMSGFPRYFIGVDGALFLNRFSNAMLIYVFIVNLGTFYCQYSKTKKKIYYICILSVFFILFGLYLKIGANIYQGYILAYGGIFLLFISYLNSINKLRVNYNIKSENDSLSLLIIGFCYIYDAINMHFLNGLIPFAAPYFTCAYSLFVIYKMKNNFYTRDKVMLESLSSIEIDQDMQLDTFLNSYKQKIKFLFPTLEIEFEKGVSLEPINNANAMEINFKNINTTMKIIDAKFDVLPTLFLKNKNLIESQIKKYGEIFFRQNELIKKNELLSMMRGRVHPHQTLSEEYFLENFEFSAVLKTHALIRGDLVGSTSLNEVYGAKTIEEIIDIYFLELFEKYKEKGIIINRLNGDEVYFIFPALSSDAFSEDCIERCYSFLQDIVGHEEALALISKKQGVLMPLRYRFVMNTADNLKSDVALKSMNQVADGELDAMKRVLDYVAGEGECVVMENAFNQIKEKSLLIELPSQRLRGKLKNIRLFALDKK